MIDLTDEQRQELTREMPQLRDPATQQTYVLVRREIYDRLQQLLPTEIELSKREVSKLVERAMKEYDEGDPTLELYQND
jgi:hypothetical protein